MKAIAEVIGYDADELLALAGRVPSDLKEMRLYLLILHLQLLTTPPWPSPVTYPPSNGGLSRNTWSI